MNELETLLNECRRNKRPPNYPTKVTSRLPRYFFDAERFRWLCNHPEEAELFLHWIQRDKPIDKIRDWLDGEMRAKA
jgi:hypothetical protein